MVEIETAQVDYKVTFEEIQQKFNLDGRLVYIYVDNAKKVLSMRMAVK